MKSEMGMKKLSGSSFERTGTSGLDIFKIAGQSISGYIPGLKTENTGEIHCPYTSIPEQMLALYLEYHPHVNFYQRGDASPAFVRARHLYTPQAEPTCTLPQLPDLVGIEFGEPELAVRPRRDANRPARGRRDRELGHDAGRGDAPDLVANELGEPKVAIGSRRDAFRPARGRRDRELTDFAGERQGAGSSKRKHADEQAEQPDK